MIRVGARSAALRLPSSELATTTTSQPSATKSRSTWRPHRPHPICPMAGAPVTG